MKDSIYISGPMTGVRNFNYESFDLAERFLLGLFKRPIINPARQDGDRVRTFVEEAQLPEELYEELLSHDLALIRDRCFLVVVLPDWACSPGSMREVEEAVNSECKILAANELGLFLPSPDWIPASQRVTP